MNIQVLESYVNRTENTRFGDSGRWIPSYATTPGELFRDCQQEYGRCTGRMYRDVRISDPFVAFGVVVPARYQTRKVGWIFEKTMDYEDSARRGRKDPYLREVWVEWREAPACRHDCC